MRQRTHLWRFWSILELFGTFWSFLGHRFVMFFFHLDFVNPLFFRFKTSVSPRQTKLNFSTSLWGSLKSHAALAEEMCAGNHLRLSKWVPKSISVNRFASEFESISSKKRKRQIEQTKSSSVFRLCSSHQTIKFPIEFRHFDFVAMEKQSIMNRKCFRLLLDVTTNTKTLLMCCDPEI